MVHCPGGGNLHYTEEDYTRDASVLACYLGRLSEASWAGHAESDPWARTEAALVAKWADVLADLSPPAPNRTSRLSFSNIAAAGVPGYIFSLLLKFFRTNVTCCLNTIYYIP